MNELDIFANQQKDRVINRINEDGYILDLKYDEEDDSCNHFRFIKCNITYLVSDKPDIKHITISMPKYFGFSVKKGNYTKAQCLLCIDYSHFDILHYVNIAYSNRSEFRTDSHSSEYTISFEELMKSSSFFIRVISTEQLRSVVSNQQFDDYEQLPFDVINCPAYQPEIPISDLYNEYKSNVILATDEFTFAKKMGDVFLDYVKIKCAEQILKLDSHALIDIEYHTELA